MKYISSSTVVNYQQLYQGGRGGGREVPGLLVKILDENREEATAVVWVGIGSFLVFIWSLKHKVNIFCAQSSWSGISRLYLFYVGCVAL